MNRLALLGGLALAALLAGCGTRSDYMPLFVGNEWTYSVRDGFKTNVEQVKVLRSLSVAETQGYELGGALGNSRLAWRGGTLLASSLSSASFSPPLPLLVPAEPTAVRQWKGTLTHLGRSEDAVAELSQEEAHETVAGRREMVLRATIVIETPRRTTKVVTSYVDGRGVLRQEQWTNGEFDVALELLSGP